MQIIKSRAVILYPETKEDLKRELSIIEAAGRTAYKSEDRITENSAIPFITNIVKRNHLAVIEFGNMVVRFIVDRGVSHEIVRHRLCSFLQESTRYCNYASGKFNNEITVIEPAGFDKWNIEQKTQWQNGLEACQEKYNKLIEGGLTPQQARAVLPNSLKTEIVVKANFREWRHIFQLRAVEKAAHPDMRNVMIPLYLKARDFCPEIFDLGDPQ